MKCILCNKSEDLQPVGFVLCKECERWRLDGSGDKSYKAVTV